MSTNGDRQRTMNKQLIKQQVNWVIATLLIGVLWMCWMLIQLGNHNSTDTAIRQHQDSITTWKMAAGALPLDAVSDTSITTPAKLFSACASVTGPNAACDSLTGSDKTYLGLIRQHNLPAVLTDIQADTPAALPAIETMPFGLPLWTLFIFDWLFLSWASLRDARKRARRVSNEINPYKLYRLRNLSFERDGDADRQKIGTIIMAAPIVVPFLMLRAIRFKLMSLIWRKLHPVYFRNYVAAGLAMAHLLKSEPGSPHLKQLREDRAAMLKFFTDSTAQLFERTPKPTINVAAAKANLAISVAGLREMSADVDADYLESPI